MIRRVHGVWVVWFFLYWGTRASNQHFSRPRVSVNAAGQSGEKLGREMPAQGARIAQGCPSAGGVRPEVSRVSGREGCVRRGWAMLSHWFPRARLTQKVQAIVKAKGCQTPQLKGCYSTRWSWHRAALLNQLVSNTVY